MIDLAVASGDALLSLLRGHPRVARVEPGDGTPLTFHQGAWVRSISVGDPATAQHGIVELMDNNPLVCADAISVPSPGVTLALIAIGPLAAAGAIRDVPMVIGSVPTDEQELSAFLTSLGWADRVTLSVEEHDLDGVAAATVMVEVDTPEDLDDLDNLFDERYARSFFVRRDEQSDWSPELVRGQPYAVFRLRITPDMPASLLTIHVLADLNGKCGAAQIVHAMNVMAGFEESLGIE